MFLIPAVFLIAVGVRKLLIRRRYKSAFFKTAIFLFILIISYCHLLYEVEFRHKYYPLIKDSIDAQISGELYKKEIKNYGTVYFLKDCYLQITEGVYPCNNVMVYVSEDNITLGSRLLASGTIKKFAKATNEGQFDAESFYQAQKIDFALKAQRVICVQEVSWSLKEKLYQIRRLLSKSINKIADPRNSGVLNSMLLGDKSLMDSDIRELYTDSGVAHILAISGLHVSIIGMGVYKLLRKKRKSFVASGIIAGYVVVCYGIMSGGAISTERACGMFLISVLAAAIGRSYDLLSGLGLMIIVILWQNPFAVYYVGFVFSVTAILGIGIAVKICVPKREKNSFVNKIMESLFSGAAIWLTTIPVVAYYYYELPIYAVFLNLIVLFLVEYLIVFGLIGALVGLVFIPLAKLIIFPAGVILAIYEFLCELSVKLPMSSIIVGRLSLNRLFGYYIFLCLAFGMIYLSKNALMSRRYKCIAVFCMICLLPIIFCEDKTKMEFDILDVGQGLAIYGDSGDGIRFFIDGGSTSDDKIGERVIIPFLKSKGIGKIDYWFVSHADDDHVSGLCYALENGYHIDNAVIYDYMVKDEAYEKLIKLAKNNNTEIIKIKNSDILCTNNISILCINQGDELYEDRNDMSLCLRIDYKKINLTITACGDISEVAEREMILEKTVQNADVYIVNHHGSKFSSSDEFLNNLNPDIAVISCGINNKYGHPAKETVERLRAHEIDIYNTIEKGEIKLINN